MIRTTRTVRIPYTQARSSSLVSETQCLENSYVFFSDYSATVVGFSSPPLPLASLSEKVQFMMLTVVEVKA